MLRVQGLLLLTVLAVSAEPAVGEAGLTALASQRAAVVVVAGDGTRTVQRLDEPDEPGEAKTVRFAIAADGRYDIVLTDPKDPSGERTRFVSDGTTTSEITLMAVGDPPLIKTRPAAVDLTTRLLACLRLDLVQLRRDYTVELVAAGALRDLRLTPSDPDVAREVSRVVVTIDASGHPVRLVLDDPSGNRHRLELSSFRDDPPLDPAWFSGP